MSEPHSQLTIERWNYLFTAELRHQQRLHPTRPESFVELQLAVGRANIAAGGVTPGNPSVLQELVRAAVWAYRIASEGCDRPGHEFEYSQYQQFDLHRGPLDEAQAPDTLRTLPVSASGGAGLPR